MEQLILHLIGDYVTQSDWMANGKTSKYGPALCHSIVYSVPFLLLRPSWAAFFVILITHFFIDRFRIAKYVVWAKNFLAPPSAYLEELFYDRVDEDFPDLISYKESLGWKLQFKYAWQNCKANGYPSETPIWLSTWLMIIADNTMHLSINYLSLRFL